MLTERQAGMRQGKRSNTLSVYTDGIIRYHHWALSSSLSVPVLNSTASA